MITLSLLVPCVGSAAAAAPLRQVAAFSCEATPPIGHPLCGGWIKPLVAVDDPLLAKGIVLADGQSRYVICVVDWCLLQTEAHDLFRRKLATAVGTSEKNVTVHTVHQHNAPIADCAAQRLLDGAPSAPLHLDLKFMEQVTDRVAAAARESCQRLRVFTHVGTGKAKVEKFASNRRVWLEDGKIHPRLSSTKDPKLQAAPEGLIDPWLRTVTLFDGAKPLVRLHYYACHPQSYYGDGRATSDTVGLARERMEREEGVSQIYFTGCAGNVTAGKYNNGTPQARGDLVGRAYTAMKESIAMTQRNPVTSFEWSTAPLKFALREEPELAEAPQRAILMATNATVLARIKAALQVAWIERIKQRPEVELSRLRLGPVQLLHLPGEAFIEYQLYAQSLRPDEFIAVAAYGESGTGYVCMDASIAEGGYEPTLSRVGPPSEARLKAAIKELLVPRQ